MDRNRGGRPRHPDVLTPAEWRVLEALRDGGTNAEIGARLGLSLDTVKYHISNMLAKLELRDRRALAAWRPDPERRRLGAVLAVPAVLWSVVGRPLVWVGVGAAAVAGVAVVVAALVALEAVVERDSEAPAAVARLPVTPSTATPALTVAPAATPSVFAAEPALTPSATPTAAPSPTPAGTPEPRPSPTPAATAPAPGSCTTPTDSTCIHAVYLGAPGDYTQVSEIPADKLLTAGASGQYHVERGQQYTVVTAAPLPAGWTRFWLDLTPLEFGVPSPVSASQLIKPVGTTYTFTVSTDTGLPLGQYDYQISDFDFRSPPRFTYDLLRAKPFVRPRPDGKPSTGAAVVSTTFQVPRFGYESFDSTGTATTAGGYTFLMRDDDSEAEGATTAVTTYEELRTSTTVLRVNVTDGAGNGQTGFYDALETGRLVEWRMADDCWARYQVTAPPVRTDATLDVAVKWYSYAFVGCSGVVDLASVDVTFDWSPANIPQGAIHTVVRHGQWQLFPVSNWARKWDGPSEPQVEVDVPDQPTFTRDTPVPHPLYREATVPQGWTTRGHGWGGQFETDNWYGYDQLYHDSDGNVAADISVAIRWRTPDYFQSFGGPFFELRVIDGYPAIVRYATKEALRHFPHDRLEPTRVWLYDPETGLEVWVVGYHPTLLGENIDGTIVIALSLMRGGE